ncbi:hypothetical protein ACGC1H_006781 [Rhizoctonia solani]|uniref:Uncharacterized protein n=1 Tax=Rhizoctonia solani TaxID=456999 RepID=A0A8H2XSN3_9AGAM|nr:unnamed protein product [Rhizoctonia solani]
MQVSNRNSPGTRRINNVNTVYPGPPPPISRPRVMTLDNVNTPSLKMVLYARQNSRQGPSSLQVHTGWVLSNLEGADDAIESLYDNLTQEDETIEEKDLESTDPRYTTDKSKVKDSSRLIGEVMGEIQKEFKSSEGPESKPYNFKLGVGRELSELLEEIKSQTTRKEAGDGWVRARSDPDDPIRDKRGYGLAATGKPRPG